MTVEQIQAELHQMDRNESDWSVGWVDDAEVYVTRYGDDFYVSRFTETTNENLYSGSNAYTAAVRIAAALGQESQRERRAGLTSSGVCATLPVLVGTDQGGIR